MDLTHVIKEPAPSLGSVSWIGADDYDEGDEFHDRATKFFASVKWDVLASHASTIRNGIPCDFGEKFSIGHFNMVRLITFEDGIRWIARLRLPELKAVFGDREGLDYINTMKVEIASMKFLRSKTSIPVPTVHGYSVDATIDIGAPYILMDYIHGTVATELRDVKECAAYPSFGTQAQDRKFMQQIADIHVQLSQVTFDQVGGLYYDESTDEFSVGPELETGRGPWQLSTDYYSALADHALKVCVADADEDVQSSASLSLPVLFKHLMSVYGNAGGTFRLANRDFGAHNLLVNDDFDIIGVIDFDGIMAAPLEVAAQYPTFAGLDQQPPGNVENRPAAIETYKKSEIRRREYKEMVTLSEARLGIASTTQPALSTCLESDAAFVYHGMFKYAGHQKFVNDKWMDGYSRMLRQHIKSGASSSKR
ncbi:hypothetical protein BU16DRAFT_571698 [Lophium mytilinum]|uniref:Aminoglycoside phosphotransferase domain-containing protein n=1 Tax=Lophium mytilinum TaxID=390894 RepID=A0A6A6QWL4_9PEZI|nr:hypothetical protein BU16DRAFT_571698 [Lophium mytilinum]